MTLVDKIKGTCSAALVTILLVAPTIAATFFTGKYAIQAGEERVRSKSSWYQITEGRNMGQWANGYDYDIASARFWGGTLAVITGTVTALGTYLVYKKVADR